MLALRVNTINECYDIHACALTADSESEEYGRIPPVVPLASAILEGVFFEVEQGLTRSVLLGQGGATFEGDPISTQKEKKNLPDQS